MKFNESTKQLIASIVSIAALVALLYYDLADASIIVPVLLAVIGGLSAVDVGRRQERKRR